MLRKRMFILWMAALLIMVSAASAYGEAGQDEQAGSGSVAVSKKTNSPNAPNKPNVQEPYSGSTNQPNNPNVPNQGNDPNDPNSPNGANEPNQPNSPNELDPSRGVNRANSPNSPNQANTANAPNDPNAPNGPNGANEPNTPNVPKRSQLIESMADDTAGGKGSVRSGKGGKTEDDQETQAVENQKKGGFHFWVRVAVLVLVAAVAGTFLVLWRKKRKANSLRNTDIPKEEWPSASEEWEDAEEEKME
ncbi:hypothetical protein D3Z38_02310 [Clostridiales bacterium]|nr:hypothetical protein [Clostridiales bacterium]